MGRAQLQLHCPTPHDLPRGAEVWPWEERELGGQKMGFPLIPPASLGWGGIRLETEGDRTGVRRRQCSVTPPKFLPHLWPLCVS